LENAGPRLHAAFMAVATTLSRTGGTAAKIDAEDPTVDVLDRATMIIITT
jgi:hypothetical protein